MPELPEVEVVRRGLEQHVIGRRFDHVEVFHPRANRGHPELARTLEGRTVTGVNRRGKYLWLALDRDALFVHLGMSGQMLVTAPNQVTSPHLRIRARMSAAGQDSVDLNFQDQRTFGRWSPATLIPDPHGLRGHIPQAIAHVAPDPLEEGFDAADVASRLVTKKSEIKRLLLDQTLVSGIGNIYADEALFYAGIRPMRRPRRVGRGGVQKILDSAAAVMVRALAAGGTSFDSLYVNVNGASGYFSRELAVYGRAGLGCRVCGAQIQRVVIGGRSAHFCPECQR